MKSTKERITSFLAILLGLSIANFGFQFFTDADFIKAFDRSFFQAVALAVVAFLDWLDRQSK